MRMAKKRETSTAAAMSISLVCLLSLVVRVVVSLGPYSGQGSPPRFGDYEAQRHWMEMTLHLPASQWYRNSSQNELLYWGLDYPPLSAYQSRLHALFLNASLPASLALRASRGFESPASKRLMRATVIVSDLAVFFPPAIYYVLFCLQQQQPSSSINNRLRQRSSSSSSSSSINNRLLALLLLNPCLLLIDHAHFQYNCISLGLTLAAVAAVFSDRDALGSVLFSLAINHKQMSLYYAPAFFAHLLAKCLQRRPYPLLHVIRLAVAVLATFALLWWPYLHSLDACLQVLSRLAPFHRGLYEDYVANFWCATSLFIKWKRLFSLPSLKLISLSFTLLASLPSLLHQLRHPTNLGFLYALLNTSFAFYLFSFQVHEKSILLPLLPASLLALEEPQLYSSFTYYALLSMYPLLCRDNLLLQYIATLALFFLLFYNPITPAIRARKTPLYSKNIIWLLPFLLSIVLHVVYVLLKPPDKYPFLFEALMMLLSFSQFAYFTFYANLKQWKMFCSATGKKDV